MQHPRRDELIEQYRGGLLNDVLPFWLEHGLDREHGGFFSCVGRDGALVDSDKAIWVQGRFTWLLATLYSTVERREDWLEAALSGLRFLEQHGADADGKLRFLVTREGQPLRRRRYYFSEAFACLAYAACARATGRDELATRAVELFETFRAGAVEPKVSTTTRPMKGLAPIMIGLHLAQELRECIGFERAEAIIDPLVDELERDFVHDEHRAVLELVTPEGGVIDHFDGRTLNPGHAIEAAWFVLAEARARGKDARLVELGCRMLDYSWERGWDAEHGGILYYTDLAGGEVQEYWHDMKFWWPHNEAVIATLTAFGLTGDERYRRWHSEVHEWAHRHFPDPEHGEWFGYLHRDGRISSSLKGNHWKGPYHIPRMQLLSWRLLAED